MTGVITAEAAASGSLFGWWVGCEAAVGGDVGEDLLDEGEHVGVLDGVDVATLAMDFVVDELLATLDRSFSQRKKLSGEVVGLGGVFTFPLVIAHESCLFSTSFDSNFAIWRSRPCAACWYLMAACGVECPRRAINSATVAPVVAARAAPLWRRSCQRKSSRPAFRAGGVEPPVQAGGRQVATVRGREQQRFLVRFNEPREVILDHGQ
jgi:hypothetical protein